MLYLVDIGKGYRMGFEFGINDGKIIITPETMTIEGNIKDAALALAKDVFKGTDEEKNPKLTWKNGAWIPVSKKAWIRRSYYDVTVLNHNGKFTIHLDATKPVEEYPAWWFEFQNHFDTICEKLGAFM